MEIDHTAQNQISPVGETTLPQLKAHLNERIVQLGENTVQFPDNPRWDALTLFLNHPRVPIRSAQVINALIGGIRTRRWSMGDFAVLDAPSHINVLNGTFSSNLGIIPLKMTGRTSGARYILEADVALLSKPPFYYRAARNSETVGIQNRNEPVSALTEEPKTTQGLWLGTNFYGSEREMITLLASTGKVPLTSEYRELVPEINDKLRSLGFYITATSNEFVLKQYDKRSQI